MPSGRGKGTDNADDLETEDLTVRVRVQGDDANEPPETPTTSVLAKRGGRLARWFKLRASLMPTKALIPEFEEFENDGKGHDSSTWDSTAASSSKSKPKKRPQDQKVSDNPNRNPSAMASEKSRAAGEIKQPRARRRSSTPRSSRRPSAEIPERSSKPGESKTPTPLRKLIILETQEQNGRIKKLRDEMAEKLEEIREIKKIQVKNKVEEKLASKIVEKQREDDEDLEGLRFTIQQELEEARLKPFKDKLESELEESMKAKQAQCRSDMEDMRTKIRNDYANQAKALMLEYEKKGLRELKQALVETKIKIRQEAAEETPRLEAFIRAQVTHDCQKIDEECDSRIEAINRERKERQLALRQRGQETIKNHRNRSEKSQELDEKVKSAYSMVEIGEKEKQKDIIEADLAQREALAMAALEREAAQKLALTRALLEEQNRKKLQEYIAAIEREVEARIKSKRIIQAGEKSKFVQHRRSLLEQIVEQDRNARPVDRQGKVQAENSEPAAIQVQQSQFAKTSGDSVGEQHPVKQVPQAHVAIALGNSTREQQPGGQLPEVSQKAESSRSSERLTDDSVRPIRTLIQEELVLREAQRSLKSLDNVESSVLIKNLKSLDSSDSSALKKSLKSPDSGESSASNKGKVKKVLFEGLKSFEEPGSLEGCTCMKDGHFVCAPLVETAMEAIKQATERPKGRSFAHPHTRESVYGRIASEHLVYEEDI